MKRLFAIIAMGVLGAAMVPAQAHDITESILVPAGAAPRIARCKDVHGQDNGTFGWEFNVASGKRGGPFTLTADDGVSDFDISFYKEWTPCDVGAEAPDDDYASDLGDEAGTIPAQATYAIITLFAGPPGASFTYSD